MSENKKSGKIVLFVTPVTILAVCAALITAVGYTPFKKAMKLSDIVFSAEVAQENIGRIKYDTKEVEAELDDGNKIVYPPFGAEYATLKIDSIDLDVPVIWGDTSDLLQNGVCQYTGSVFIGMQGNVVLAAHCNTFFYYLGDMKPGDTAVLTTSYGEFTYKMTEQIMFKDTDNSYLYPTEEDRLTMYTCYGNLLGPTEDRIGVICELVEKKFYE
ncbi:MAG: class D sortase [Clostridium sp.]|nr:class D sortase [Clostridium sp.]MCM1546840.1 class D sortase [Ruminococcus sp.]